MINGIKDYKGIPVSKLEHIFIGTVKGKKISGFHHENYTWNDTKCKTIGSKEFSTLYMRERVYTASVVDIKNGYLKKGFGGKSTFFPYNWSRQAVVDCIDRSTDAIKVTTSDGKEERINYGEKKIEVKQDSQTGVIIFKGGTIYPFCDIKGIIRK